MRRQIVYIFGLLITTSCRQNSNTDTTLSQSGTFRMITNSFNDDNYRIIEIDSNERTIFWDAITIPIIKANKSKVLSTMDFPVSVEWEHIMTSEKNANSTTAESFQKIYDSFFNSDFIAALNSQTSQDFQAGQLRDTIWYTIYIARQKDKSNWDVGLSLDYFKSDTGYKLKYVRAIAGDFYHKQ